MYNIQFPPMNLTQNTSQNNPLEQFRASHVMADEHFGLLTEKKVNLFTAKDIQAINNLGAVGMIFGKNGVLATSDQHPSEEKHKNTLENVILKEDIQELNPNSDEEIKALYSPLPSDSNSQVNKKNGDNGPRDVFEKVFSKL